MILHEDDTTLPAVAVATIRGTDRTSGEGPQKPANSQSTIGCMLAATSAIVAFVMYLSTQLRHASCFLGKTAVGKIFLHASSAFDSIFETVALFSRAFFS